MDKCLYGEYSIETPSYTSLNYRQKKVFDLMLKGEDIIITGFQQTGKTFLLKAYENWCKQQNKFNVIYDLDDAKKGHYNIAIFDDVVELDKSFIRYIRQYRKRFDGNCQIIVVATSNAMFGATIGKYFESVDDSKLIKSVEKLFQQRIHWRRPLLKDMSYELDFSERGSCESNYDSD